MKKDKAIVFNPRLAKKFNTYDSFKIVVEQDVINLSCAECSSQLEIVVIEPFSKKGKTMIILHLQCPKDRWCHPYAFLFAKKYFEKEQHQLRIDYVLGDEA